MIGIIETPRLPWAMAIFVALLVAGAYCVAPDEQFSPYLELICDGRPCDEVEPVGETQEVSWSAVVEAARQRDLERKTKCGPQPEGWIGDWCMAPWSISAGSLTIDMTEVHQ